MRRLERGVWLTMNRASGVSMPPKKRRKQNYSKEEWKVERGRRYRKQKNAATKGDANTEVTSGVDPRGAGYTEIVKENTLLEKYYQGLGFIPPSDWPVFLSTMKESLPATFRVTGTRSLANHVLSCLKKRFFGELVKLEVDGEQVSPPTPLPWYPGNLAWNVPLTRKIIRKSPLLVKFHSFLVRESEQGNISRQEAVSMIPPLVLDVQPSHKVLDMCAAPGSKTAQLIESLHAEDAQLIESMHAEDGVGSPIPSGVVVANDSNNKRCYMLVHQAKRLNSPCFMVTNHDASVFPMLYYHDENNVRHPIHYDRVLCDVPCSGDGTLRKNPTIWQSWTALLGPSLHKLQLRILNRGLELLAPKGRLVYSTCSLNPIENEAVVAAALGLCKGSVALVDCKAMLPGLVTLDGLTSWKAMSKEGEWLSDFDSLPKTLVRNFAKTMFPPENVDELGLEKCIRVLPHYQDTGAFFIAVFEKKEWLPWQSKMKKAQNIPPPSSSAQVDNANQDAPVEEVDNIKEEVCNKNSDIEATATATTNNSGGKDVTVESMVTKSDEERPTAKVLGRPDFHKKKMRGFKEDPYIFFEDDSDFFNSIRPYYGFPEDFPLNQMLTRSRIGKKRNVYFSSKLIKEITIRNEHVVKIINIGVKVMSRCEYAQTPCQFRLCQEGVESLIPYIYNHRVHVKQEDLSILLKEANPFITSLSSCAQDGLQPLGIGPVVFIYVPDEKDSNDAHKDDSVVEGTESPEISITCPLYISGWLAAKSVRLYLDKNYRYHFLSMLGYDPPTDQCLDTLNSNRGRSKVKVDKPLPGEDAMEEDSGGTEDDVPLAEKDVMEVDCLADGGTENDDLIPPENDTEDGLADGDSGNDNPLPPEKDTKDGIVHGGTECGDPSPEKDGCGEKEEKSANILEGALEEGGVSSEGMMQEDAPKSADVIQT